MEVSKLYTTKEIQTVIQKNYLKKIAKFFNGNPACNIFYREGGENCIEGLYIWSDEKGYNYLYTEKGRIYKHIITNDFFDIIYVVLDEYIWNLSIKYAREHLDPNKDFRRALFDRQVELWRMLDERGEKKCIEHIEKILSEHPFDDN